MPTTKRRNKTGDLRTRRPNGGKWSSIDKISKEKVKLLILDGWPETKIAKFFNLSYIGWRGYKKRHPKFLAQIQDWRAEAARDVERSLFKRAKGFNYVEVERKQVPMTVHGSRKMITVELKKTKKKSLGSVDAAKFILTNIQRDRYKNHQDSNNMNMNGNVDDRAFSDKFFGVKQEEED